jgi:hypothetical protein
MSKQDLTGYSENELSLIVFNDEYLYRVRCNRNLKDILNDHFTFTDEQFDVLQEDLNDDEVENA